MFAALTARQEGAVDAMTAQSDEKDAAPEGDTPTNEASTNEAKNDPPQESVPVPSTTDSSTPSSRQTLDWTAIDEYEGVIAQGVPATPATCITREQTRAPPEDKETAGDNTARKYSATTEGKDTAGATIATCVALDEARNETKGDNTTRNESDQKATEEIWCGS